MIERIKRNGQLIREVRDGSAVVGKAAPETPPLPPPMVYREAKVKDVSRFLRTVIEAASSGEPLVSEEEAMRRSAICCTCPMNGIVPRCMICKASLGIIAKYLGRRGEQLPKELAGCKVCHCDNRVAVWVNLQAQQAAIDKETNKEFPETCWKKVI